LAGTGKVDEPAQKTIDDSPDGSVEKLDVEVLGALDYGAWWNDAES
jgi:hypothetical protein